MLLAAWRRFWSSGGSRFPFHANRPHDLSRFASVRVGLWGESRNESGRTVGQTLCPAGARSCSMSDGAEPSEPRRRQKKVKVYIRLMGGKTLTLAVTPETTMLRIKELVAETEGCPP